MEKYKHSNSQLIEARCLLCEALNTTDEKAKNVLVTTNIIKTEQFQNALPVIAQLQHAQAFNGSVHCFQTKWLF